MVKALVDIVNNVLKGRMKIKNKYKLKRFQNSLRELTQPKLSLAKRKVILIQKGGFLPFLAPLIPLFIKAAAVAGPLIAKAAAFAGPALAKGALAGAAGTAVSAIGSKILTQATTK
jgi:hypothetical protein